ncbi:hypothetical protein GINT2_001950 [Glugoides intestinalis]
MAQITLQEFKIRSCSNFIKSLYEFKNTINKTELQAGISSLHTNFLVLNNSFEIEEQERSAIVELGKEGNIRKIKAYGLTLSLYEDLVIDIDDAHSEIAKLFVNKQIEAALEQAKLLCDYEKRVCDICGQYFLKPMFDTPIKRLQMKDFVLSTHDQCFLNSDYL